MTDLERLKAELDAAICAALNAVDAVVYADRDAARDADRDAALDAFATATTYLAALAAQEKEQTNG